MGTKRKLITNGDDRPDWHALYQQASNKAAKHLPTAAGWQRITKALEAARKELGGEDVTKHVITFDPARWQFEPVALPDHVWRTGSISRGCCFAIAKDAADTAGNWQLFCASHVFGQGPNGYGPARFKRILRRTPPEDVVAVVDTARNRLREDGPLSAYDYLRGNGTAATVPHWGPAFFTKLLYAADMPGAVEGALILDNVTARVVADTSRMPHFVDARRQSQRWTAYRYGIYLAWMTLVAAHFEVPRDFLEYALFLDGRRRTKRGR